MTPDDKPQEPQENTTNIPWTGAPAARAGASEAELGRAREAGLNTDARGGPGSAARAHPEANAGERGASPGSGPADGESTEPRSHTHIGKHSSQGLTGAQGSGGGAERPPRTERR